MAMMGPEYVGIAASDFAAWRTSTASVLGAHVEDGPGGPPEDLWREDRVLPLDKGMILSKQIPRAQRRVIPQRGHRVMWERAAEFDRVAPSFFGAGQ